MTQTRAEYEHERFVDAHAARAAAQAYVTNPTTANANKLTQAQGGALGALDLEAKRGASLARHERRRVHKALANVFWNELGLTKDQLSQFVRDKIDEAVTRACQDEERIGRMVSNAVMHEMRKVNLQDKVLDAVRKAIQTNVIQKLNKNLQVQVKLVPTKESSDARKPGHRRRVAD